MLLCIFFSRSQVGQLDGANRKRHLLSDSDEDGLHDWCARGTSRAPGSHRACPEVVRSQSPSRTFYSRKQSTSNTSWSSGGGNCKSNRPLILVEVHPLSFHAKQEATSLSAPPPFRSAVCLLLPHTLPSFFGYIHPIIVMGGHFLWRVEKLRFSRSGANRTTISTDSCVTVHARSSGVPADKHTSLHRASCLQNTAAVFSCVYSASAQQHFSNNSFCTWSTAARM